MSRFVAEALKLLRINITTVTAGTFRPSEVRRQPHMSGPIFYWTLLM